VDALSAERIDVTFDVGALAGGSLVLETVVVDEPTLTYEFGPHGSNVAAIRRSVDTRVAAAMAGPEGEGSPPPWMAVNDLRVHGGRVRLLSDALRDEELTGRLPDLHLEHLVADGGAPAARIVQLLLANLAKGVGPAIGSLRVRRGAAPADSDP
jgi:hypothetical protein